MFCVLTTVSHAKSPALVETPAARCPSRTSRLTSTPSRIVTPARRTLFAKLVETMQASANPARSR